MYVWRGPSVGVRDERQQTWHGTKGKYYGMILPEKSVCGVPQMRLISPHPRLPRNVLLPSSADGRGGLLSADLLHRLLRYDDDVKRLACLGSGPAGDERGLGRLHILCCFESDQQRGINGLPHLEEQPVTSGRNIRYCSCAVSLSIKSFLDLTGLQIAVHACVALPSSNILTGRR